MGSHEEIDKIITESNNKKQKLEIAKQVLIKHRLLIPSESLELFHGRASDPNEVDKWKVDPAYNNANNNTGNHNLNVVSALSTATKKQDAASYAYIRKMMNQGTVAEVYDMKADKGTFIINDFSFKMKNLSEADKKDVLSALNVFANYGYTELAPVEFEFRDSARVVLEAVLNVIKNEGHYIFDEDVAKVCAQLKSKNPNIKEKLVSDIAGAVNARFLLSSDPSMVVQHYAVRNNKEERDTIEDKTKIKFADKNGKNTTGPINLEYVSAWLANNNIIGISINVGVENCLIFDLERINTEKAQGEKYQSIMDQYGEISNIVENFTPNDKINKFFEQANPSEVIKLMMAHEKFKGLLDAPARVWEGFSIGQHTESTLRVFEDSFEKTTPKELAPFIKMALVCHDIGKGVAKNRETMHEETQKYTREVMEYFQVSQPVQKMLLFAIGEAQGYTSAYYINKNLNGEKYLKERCKEVLTESLNREPTAGEISGFVQTCKIIQSCDSGAYTRYGVTRDNLRKVYHKNGNDLFTKSFHKPTDLKKRSQQMIEPVQREQ